MGVAGSFVERPDNAMLLSIKQTIQDADASSSIAEVESDDEEATDTDEKRRDIDTKRDLQLFHSISAIVMKWSKWHAFQNDVIFCDLMEIDEAIARAFDTGRTPLVFDTSEDDKLSTYLSYQPNVVLLEARTLIIESSKKSLVDVMDYARVRLVGAMKHGKLLVIRMGTAAPDFKSTFNDDVLIARGLIASYSKEDPAVKVLEANRRKSLLRTSRQSNAAQSNSGEGGDEEEEEDEEELGFHETQRRYFSAAAAASNEASSSAPPAIVGEAYFPREVFEHGGLALRKNGWPERLFREEDMKPHKNFAYCRDEFRVMLVSQLPLSDVDEYLFGAEWGGLPLPKDLFKIVSVTYEDENESEGGDKQATEAAAGVDQRLGGCGGDDDVDDEDSTPARVQKQSGFQEDRWFSGKR